MRGGEAAAMRGGEALAWALTIRRRGVTWRVSAAEANKRTDTTDTHWHRLPSGRHRLTARHGADERRRQRLQGTLEHERTNRGAGATTVPALLLHAARRTAGVTVQA